MKVDFKRSCLSQNAFFPQNCEIRIFLTKIFRHSVFHQVRLKYDIRSFMKKFKFKKILNVVYLGGILNIVYFTEVKTIFAYLIKLHFSVILRAEKTGPHFKIFKTTSNTLHIRFFLNVVFLIQSFMVLTLSKEDDKSFC